MAAHTHAGEGRGAGRFGGKGAATCCATQHGDCEEYEPGVREGSGRRENCIPTKGLPWLVGKKLGKQNGWTPMTRQVMSKTGGHL